MTRALTRALSCLAAAAFLMAPQLVHAAKVRLSQGMRETIAHAAAGRANAALSTKLGYETPGIARFSKSHVTLTRVGPRSLRFTAETSDQNAYGPVTLKAQGRVRLYSAKGVKDFVIGNDVKVQVQQGKRR